MAFVPLTEEDYLAEKEERGVEEAKRVFLSALDDHGATKEDAEAMFEVALRHDMLDEVRTATGENTANYLSRLVLRHRAPEMGWVLSSLIPSEAARNDDGDEELYVLALRAAYADGDHRSAYILGGILLGRDENRPNVEEALRLFMEIVDTRKGAALYAYTGALYAASKLDALDASEGREHSHHHARTALEIARRLETYNYHLAVVLQALMEGGGVPGCLEKAAELADAESVDSPSCLSYEHMSIVARAVASGVGGVEGDPERAWDYVRRGYERKRTSDTIRLYCEFLREGTGVEADPDAADAIMGEYEEEVAARRRRGDALRAALANGASREQARQAAMNCA